MRKPITIKINFCGGIISPGDLLGVLEIVSECGVDYVSFGLRQQMLITVNAEDKDLMLHVLREKGVSFQTELDKYPNIVSSYPAEEIFITQTWLSEGVYKDIFDEIDYQPLLKINVSDRNQSFTPMLTGNINWVASPHTHFWYLFIRFPKTNTVYEWTELVYTNDIPRMSKEIESLILSNREKFYDIPAAKGEELMHLLQKKKYNTRPAEKNAVLPPFNLPYYEGINRYNNSYWLGVYRRDELFAVDFLKELCALCLETKIGQLCSTPWKSIIVKGIAEEDKGKWNLLLNKHQINMRHAANELNIQVEDNCREGIRLKNFFVKKLNKEDVRTYGICFGIKTKKKSEVFSNILIRRRPLIRLFGWEFLYVYDILCARDFNPNARTESVFSGGNFLIFMGEHLRRVVAAYYESMARRNSRAVKETVSEATHNQADEYEYVYQCTYCLTVYDEITGEPENGIMAGTSFEALSPHYGCPLCDSPKEDFVKIEKAKLGLQAV